MQDKKWSEGDLRIITFLWGSRYTVEHVEKLKSMLDRHISIPFQMVLLSDRQVSIKGVKRYPFRSRGRGCWSRLKLFSPEFEVFTGSRYFAIDLDMVILRDITDIVTRPEPFVITRSDNPYYPDNPYSGTMWLATPQAVPDLWERYQKARREHGNSNERLKKWLMSQGFNGTDSAWIGYQMGPDVPTFTRDDGVVSYPWDIAGEGRKYPPEDSRIILFHGRENDPADPKLQRKHPWITDHWR